MGNTERYLYVMLSKTDTVVAKYIQKKTNCRFSHASISFDREMTRLYSFARRRLHNFLIAGFIHEDLDNGVFSWYPDAPVCLYRIKVTEEVYRKAETIVDSFIKNYRKHTYNTLGLIAIKRNKELVRKYKYTCSQFVAHVLKESGAVDLKKSIWLTVPDDLIDLPGGEVIYEGCLANVRASIRDKGELLNTQENAPVDTGDNMQDNVESAEFDTDVQESDKDPNDVEVQR